jgi:hypothetical protein
MMGYQDRLAPHIQAMVDEIPTTALKVELAEAIAYAFQWETWRQSQDPPPADTQANRIAYAKNRWAWSINNQVRGWIAAYRRRGDDEQSEID